MGLDVPTACSLPVVRYTRPFVCALSKRAHTCEYSTPLPDEETFFADSSPPRRRRRFRRRRRSFIFRRHHHQRQRVFLRKAAFGGGVFRQRALPRAKAAAVFSKQGERCGLLEAKMRSAAAVFFKATLGFEPTHYIFSVRQSNQ